MPTSRRFTDKVAFITGAATGIGRATALAFATEGARVVVADLPGADQDETVRLITDQGGTASLVDCDVTSNSEVVTALEHTISTYGRLDAAFTMPESSSPTTSWQTSTTTSGTASSTSTFEACTCA